jgi:hypothetical protein
LRLGRVLRVAVLAGLSVYALYLVAINVFLSTPLFDKVVNAQRDVIEVHFARAWSISPQHIHARQLSIRGRDGSVEWILRLDKVEFDVALLALVRQRFEASNVHGDGISMRLRQRLRAPPASPEEVATLPPIDDLPPYSMRPPETPSPGESVKTSAAERSAGRRRIRAGATPDRLWSARRSRDEAPSPRQPTREGAIAIATRVDGATGPANEMNT